jgi:hypothetical protein
MDFTSRTSPSIGAFTRVHVGFTADALIDTKGNIQEPHEIGVITKVGRLVLTTRSIVSVATCHGWIAVALVDGGNLARDVVQFGQHGTLAAVKANQVLTAVLDLVFLLIVNIAVVILLREIVGVFDSEFTFETGIARKTLATFDWVGLASSIVDTTAMSSNNI